MESHQPIDSRLWRAFSLFLESSIVYNRGRLHRSDTASPPAVFGQRRFSLVFCSVVLAGPSGHRCLYEPGRQKMAVSDGDKVLVGVPFFFLLSFAV